MCGVWVETEATRAASRAGTALITQWVRAGWSGRRIARALRMGQSRVQPLVAEIRDDLLGIGWAPPLDLDRMCPAPMPAARAA